MIPTKGLIMQTARVLHVFCLQKSYVPPKEKKSFFLENVHVLHCDQQLPSSACYTGHTDTRPKLSFYTRVVRESQAQNMGYSRSLALTTSLSICTHAHTNK